MAAADADYAFIFVDVGAEGSQGDSQVFRDSVFGKKLANNRLKLPKAECIPNSDIEVPYFFVGDGAFSLRPNLMKPFAARKMSLKHALFNYRLSRARRVVENAFGILAARWRIFKQPICSLLETTDDIVTAACCLHNLIIRSSERELRDKYIPEKFVDSEGGDGAVRRGLWQSHVAGDSCAWQPAPNTTSRNSSKCALKMRETLADYFSNEGAVPWQIERIRKGFWGAYVNQNELPNQREDEMSEDDLSDDSSDND